MCADVPALRKGGQRVRVHTVTPADLQPYHRAVEASSERLRPWNPVNPGDLAYHLRIQSPLHRTFLVRALQPRGDHDIVGKVNVTNVVRGRALAGSMGYDSYDPYAGQGLFAEGLRLVIDVAFAPEPAGMGLHRLDASVQPGNLRSAGLLRRLGLRRRGSWPGFLWLADGTGAERWRDHVTYGITAEQWPAPPYAADELARPVVVVLAADQAPTAGAYAVARTLALEVGAPLVRVHGETPEVGGSRLAERLADAVTGAVVLTDLDGPVVAAALGAASLGEGVVVTTLAAVTTPADVVRLALQARAGAGIDP